MQPDPAHARFWQWFRDNGNRLAAAMYGPDQAAREAAADELRDAVQAVAEGLVLEVGPDLTLRVRGLTPANERLRGLGASLLAQHAVGERDALTMLSALNMEPLPKDPAAAGLRPFRDLVVVFDETRARKYPPPGALV